MESEVADHCVAFALSDPNNSVAVAGVLRDVLVTLKLGNTVQNWRKCIANKTTLVATILVRQLLELSQAIMRVSRCRDLNFQVLKVAREIPTARQLQ